MPANTKQIRQFEKVSKAPRSIEQEHAKIHDGNAYTFSHQQSMSAANSHTLLIVTPPEGFIHYRPLDINAEAAPFRFTLHEDSGIDANSLGAPIEYLNMNRNTTNVSSVLMYHDPIITSANSLGTLLRDKLLHSAGVQGGGSSNISTFEWVLMPSTNYVITFTNQSGGATQFTHEHFFYESDNA